MKNVKIQHGLYKNLPSGTIYNSQAACLVFTMGVAFKLSAAPGIVSQHYGSSTLWLYLMMSVLEVALTIVIFAFVRMRGDDFLRCINAKSYRVLCGVASVWLTLKGTFYFCYCVSYLTHELFGGVEPSLIYLLFLAPIVYLGIKGARSISRSAEIFVPVFFVLIVVNLIFLEADMDFGRNLPIFALAPAEFFARMPRYGLWLGDALPFIFLRIKNKRLPYISASVAVTLGLVGVVLLLGVALYGDALVMVSDLLIHLAGFNQLSLEIGRMEWTNLFGVVALSIFSLSFLYFGAVAASERAFKSSIPGILIYPATVAGVVLAVSSSEEVIKFSIGKIGYGLFAIAMALPTAILVIALIKRKKFAGIYGRFDEEYLPYPAPQPVTPNSLADNIMTDYKQSVTDSASIGDNGVLQPQQEGK